MTRLSRETGGEQDEKRKKINSGGRGGARDGGATHQDVSLQEQPRLNGDADAGLAVSLDIAKGDRQRDRGLLTGLSRGPPPAAPPPRGCQESSLMHPSALLLEKVLDSPPIPVPSP